MCAGAKRGGITQHRQPPAAQTGTCPRSAFQNPDHNGTLLSVVAEAPTAVVDAPTEAVPFVASASAAPEYPTRCCRRSRGNHLLHVLMFDRWYFNSTVVMQGACQQLTTLDDQGRLFGCQFASPRPVLLCLPRPNKRATSNQHKDQLGGGGAEEIWVNAHGLLLLFISVFDVAALRIRCLLHATRTTHHQTSPIQKVCQSILRYTLTKVTTPSFGCCCCASHQDYM